MMPSPEEEGYALIAALGALIVFSLLAFTMLAAERGGLAGVAAFRERTRMEAAADAGLVLALEGLAIADRARAWGIDGQPRALDFDGMRLTVRIEDERGKLQLNQLSDEQARAMFEAAGAGGRQLDTLTDAFLDWRDPDDERRPNGAEAADYAAQGIRPRNGPLVTVSELRTIKGMDETMFARLSPAVTTFFGQSGGFAPENASPLALAVMSGAGMGSPAVIERERELAGQRPALAIADPPDLAGRALTVRVAVDDGPANRFERATVIEFPTGPGPNWVIRARE